MVVKSVIVDEVVESRFKNGSTQPSVGLLIGTLSEKDEFWVAHFAESAEEELESSEMSNDDSETENPLQLTPKSITKINLKTIAHHAKQAIRMLPGGLFIVGIYSVESVDSIFTTKYEDSIKNALVSINKQLTKSPFYGAEFSSNPIKIVLHFNPSTQKFICKGVDISCFKNIPLEVRFSCLSWAKLSCEYDTSFSMHLRKSDVGLPLRKNIHPLLSSFKECVESAKFLLNGRSPSKSIEFVEPSILSERGGGDSDNRNNGSGNNSGSSSPLHLSDDDSEAENNQDKPISPITILVKKAPAVLEDYRDGGQDFVSHIRLMGKIAVMAFAPRGSSTLTLANCLKTDILRSLASRIDMHCESLVEEEGSEDGLEGGTNETFHEIPRRVFAPLSSSQEHEESSSGLLFTDYLFPGEGPSDSLTSFRISLGLQVEGGEEAIILTKETAFNLEEMRGRGSVEELLLVTDSVEGRNIGRMKHTLIGIVGAITFLLIALIFKLFYN